MSDSGRLVRPHQPSPELVGEWNDHLHGDLTNVTLRPSADVITLSWTPIDGAEKIRVRRFTPQPPPMTRWQRAARWVRLARLRAVRKVRRDR